MNVATIRDNLATRLATITGLRVFDTLPDQLNYPGLAIGHVEGPRQATIGGYWSLALQLVLMAAPAELGVARGQDAADPYLATSGTKSILAALNTDKTLGGAVDTLSLGDPGAVEVIEANEVPFVGAVLPLEVWGS